MRDYSAMTTLVRDKIQTTSTADFSVAEVNNALSRALVEVSDYHPHVVPITFDMESRTGSDVTATASSLTDSVKKQFVSADATNEKVVHNVTRNTRAVVLTVSSSSVVPLASNLMTADDDYAIYNKQCWNKRQVFIGDVPGYQGVDSVEFPVGQRRNYKIYDRVLEIDTDNVPDSNSNTSVVSVPNNVQALVRFNHPQALPNLSDFKGTVAGTAATVGATTLASSSWQSAGTINIGTELTIENHRTTYIVAASAAIASNTASLEIYPGLEAPATSTWVITIRQTSLDMGDEEIVAKLAAGRLLEDKANKFPNAIPLGGGAVWQNYRVLATSMVNEALLELRRKTTWQTSRRYPTE